MNATVTSRIGGTSIPLSVPVEESRVSDQINTTSLVNSISTSNVLTIDAPTPDEILPTTTSTTTPEVPPPPSSSNVADSVPIALGFTALGIVGLVVVIYILRKFCLPSTEGVKNRRLADLDDQNRASVASTDSAVPFNRTPFLKLESNHSMDRHQYPPFNYIAPLSYSSPTNYPPVAQNYPASVPNYPNYSSVIPPNQHLLPNNYQYPYQSNQQMPIQNLQNPYQGPSYSPSSPYSPNLSNPNFPLNQLNVPEDPLLSHTPGEAMKLNTTANLAQAPASPSSNVGYRDTTEETYNK